MEIPIRIHTQIATFIVFGSSLKVERMDIFSWFQLGGMLVGVEYGYNMLHRFLTCRASNRWKNTPKNKVILHAVPRGKTIPSLSPFALKVETFLRMAKIDYEIDSNDVCYGPTGKFPWISLNGEQYGDSQLIIQLLEKKFEKSFNGTYSDDELAKATAIRVMLEEHFFFGGVAMWRFVFDGKESLDKIFNAPPMYIWLLRTLYGMKIRTQTWYHGIGRNTEEEITGLMTRDLESVSLLIGTKKFILGDEPCRDDCAIFAILAQAVWGMPESPYQKMVDEQYQNIKEYCIRMKELFYPDWDELIAVENQGIIEG